MNKRYIDFVPVNARKAEATEGEVKRETARVASKPKTERPEVMFSSRGSAQNHVAKKEPETQSAGVEPEFGVVKDLAEAEKELKAVKDSKAEKPAKNPLSRPKFVNTEKVVKRPLSKNVYPKKAVVEKEEPKKPVTIITKPEKDSRVGIVVAVILTIILGAAAGTVAFLLLPK